MGTMKFRYSRPETPAEKATRIAKATKAAAARAAAATKPIDHGEIAKEAAKLIPVPINGRDGERGSLWHFGTGEPDAIAGQADGDFFLSTISGDVFALDFGDWALIGNICGSKGDPGNDGARGKNGKDGSKWLEGPRDPNRSDGKDSDFWLNNKTLDLFQKQSGVWRMLTNLRGPRGFTGPRGPDGSPGRDGVSGGGESSILFGDGPPPEGGIVGQVILVGDGVPS
jgi:hypothetical protein